MTTDASVDPRLSPAARGGGDAHHELMDDVVGDEESSKTQRWIGWLCGLLTLAAAVALWRLT
ncbi:MAG TPA: hypothetical protein PLP50_07815 [Thermoanaerobaculia bacterium]|jgi:hypothetical protein|nr:hypothetical protein [Thermoanaerobaculia bacterium]HPA51495.1 hypothetical protein [Thermoanaerobaculia bacterium]HQN07191.1 hypothetical protein [Thermoanaerobaculia bacterium]HQP85776.1 hypothetical protein [Thermoanaerobaculia bacterium]